MKDVSLLVIRGESSTVIEYSIALQIPEILPKCKKVIIIEHVEVFSRLLSKMNIIKEGNIEIRKVSSWCDLLNTALDLKEKNVVVILPALFRMYISDIRSFETINKSRRFMLLVLHILKRIVKSSIIIIPWPGTKKTLIEYLADKTILVKSPNDLSLSEFLHD